MDRIKAEKILKDTFNINQFYDEQWEAISNLLNGERLLMIQKTGFGKSLCFQFPATQLEGLTIVFSPLIALMRDQVTKLKALGIRAEAINSEEANENNRSNLERAVNGELTLLYIAPERLGNQEFMETIKKMDTEISLIVIDEAHCISVWGHDFRPEFNRIINLIRKLPYGTPVLATTATATKVTQLDILGQVGDAMSVIRGSLMRENFELFVTQVKSEDEKLKFLAQYLTKFEGTGIIYTGTRVNTEIYARYLEHIGISAIEYNAGLDTEKRIRIENGLLNNDWKVVVSTNALGMGMDKPDIRFIIHTQVPQSIIHYYQEIGRAGRDGKNTKIILLFNSHGVGHDMEEDMKLPISFIENARPSIAAYNRIIQEIQEAPLSESEIMRATNLRQQQVRVIKADLLNQNIAIEIIDGRTKKLEFNFGAPELSEVPFRELKEFKRKELEFMREYIFNKGARMKYLCSYLGDEINDDVKNCDNTNLVSLHYQLNEKIETELNRFWDNFFPIIRMAPKTIVEIDEIKFEISSPFWSFYELRGNQRVIGKEEDPRFFLNLFDGDNSGRIELLIIKHLDKVRVTDVITTGYYSYPKVGSAIRSSKYQDGGDFPEFLVERMSRAFKKHLEYLGFDIIVFVPPTESGNLVENLANRLSRIIGIPVFNIIQKVRNTMPQKMYENRYLKTDNVKDAFSLVLNISIMGKKVLLIDDVIDSGATIKEIAKLLHSEGALMIAPLVLAKTIGGDEL